MRERLSPSLAVPKRAVVVYEDDEILCVAAFEYLKVRGIEHAAVSGTLEDDVVLGARVTCQSYGTFTESILCLSEHAAAYAFREAVAFAGHNNLQGCGVQELLLKKRCGPARDRGLGSADLERDTRDTRRNRATSWCPSRRARCAFGAYHKSHSSAWAARGGGQIEERYMGA